MGVSIYYMAYRKEPLSGAERANIDRAIARYSVEAQIKQFCSTGVGFNWESFCVYDQNDPSEPDVIFEGATDLPSNSDEATKIGMQRWCHLLSEIRQILPTAASRVHVDDLDVFWDASLGKFDPFR